MGDIWIAVYTAMQQEHPAEEQPHVLLYLTYPYELFAERPNFREQWSEP